MDNVIDLSDDSQGVVLISLEAGEYYTYTCLSELQDHWSITELEQGQNSGEIVIRELGPIRKFSVSIQWDGTDKPDTDNAGPAASVELVRDDVRDDDNASDAGPADDAYYKNWWEVEDFNKVAHIPGHYLSHPSNALPGQCLSDACPKCPHHDTLLVSTRLAKLKGSLSDVRAIVRHVQCTECDAKFLHETIELDGVNGTRRMSVLKESVL